MKPELPEWASFNRRLLAEHALYATGTTGGLLERKLGLPIVKLEGGTFGSDMQIGAEIDLLICYGYPASC